MTTPHKGDKFDWRADPSDTHGVWVTVLRVARDGAWADIACYDGNIEWTKRQPLPLPDTFRAVMA